MLLRGCLLLNLSNPSWFARSRANHELRVSRQGQEGWEVIFIQADLSKDGDCVIKSIIAVSLDTLKNVKDDLFNQAMCDVTAFSCHNFVANPLPNL